jgi:hypothetical protein
MSIVEREAGVGRAASRPVTTAETAPETAPETAAERPPEAVADAAAGALAASLRPADLPAQLWDDDAGCVRTEALVAAYLDLQRKAGEDGRRNVPARPEDYVINVEGDLFTSDAEVNEKLHAAGLDQEQVQLVYDLAATRLLPVVAELSSRFEAESQVERLKLDFGGEEAWREVARQIRLWGESNLPAETFSVLSSSREGVLAMHKMMAGSEPPLLGNGGRGKTLPTEDELKEMMRDPRYWRDRDARFVEKVREGFRQIYDQ